MVWSSLSAARFQKLGKGSSNQWSIQNFHSFNESTDASYLCRFLVKFNFLGQSKRIETEFDCSFLDEVQNMFALILFLALIFVLGLVTLAVID